MKLLKKLIYKLKLWDFIWSIPLSFITFVLYGIFQESFFNDKFYSTEWYHRAFLASAIVLLFHGASALAINFNFRGIFRYWYSKDSSIKEDFKQIPPWLKVLLFPLLYFAMLLILILVYHLTGSRIEIPLN